MQNPVDAHPNILVPKDQQNQNVLNFSLEVGSKKKSSTKAIPHRNIKILVLWMKQIKEHKQLKEPVQHSRSK